MEKKAIIGNNRTFFKIVLAIVLLYLVLRLIEQISVYQTLKGDGKINHVVVKLKPGKN
jgi:hypothetical protein